MGERAGIEGKREMVDGLEARITNRARQGEATETEVRGDVEERRSRTREYGTHRG